MHGRRPRGVTFQSSGPTILKAPSSTAGWGTDGCARMEDGEQAGGGCGVHRFKDKEKDFVEFAVVNRKRAHRLQGRGGVATVWLTADAWMVMLGLKTQLYDFKELFNIIYER